MSILHNFWGGWTLRSVAHKKRIYCSLWTVEVVVKLPDIGKNGRERIKRKKYITNSAHGLRIQKALNCIPGIKNIRIKHCWDHLLFFASIWVWSPDLTSYPRMRINASFSWQLVIAKGIQWGSCWYRESWNTAVLRKESRLRLWKL